MTISIPDPLQPALKLFYCMSSSPIVEYWRLIESIWQQKWCHMLAFNSTHKLTAQLERKSGVFNCPKTREQKIRPLFDPYSKKAHVLSHINLSSYLLQFVLCRVTVPDREQGPVQLRGPALQKKRRRAHGHGQRALRSAGVFLRLVSELQRLQHHRFSRYWNHFIYVIYFDINRQTLTWSFDCLQIHCFDLLWNVLICLVSFCLFLFFFFLFFVFVFWA